MDGFPPRAVEPLRDAKRQRARRAVRRRRVALARLARGIALVVASAGVIYFLYAVGLPAAPMLGALAAAAVFALGGKGVSLPALAPPIAHAIIGCMVAASADAAFFTSVREQPGISLGAAVGSVATAALMAILLAKLAPASLRASYFGMLPGAGPLMVVLAEECRSDPALVAIMQYSRVWMIAVAAGAVSFFAAAPHAPLTQGWLSVSDAGSLMLLAVLVALGASATRVSRFPNIAFLFPFGLGAAVQATGVATVHVPPLVATLALLIVGWQIGGQFTAAKIRQYRHVLPATMLAAAGLVVVNALFATVISRYFGLDFYSVLLATAPGGIDSVMVLALAADANTPLIVATQLSRLFVVLTIATVSAWWIKRDLGAP